MNTFMAYYSNIIDAREVFSLSVKLTGALYITSSYQKGDMNIRKRRFDYFFVNCSSPKILSLFRNVLNSVNVKVFCNNLEKSRIFTSFQQLLNFA